ncbi:MAG: NADP-specific glutamate dehydrogenase [Promethearchaeota archaeon]
MEDYIQSVISQLESKDAGQKEFHQAAREVLTSLLPALKKYPALKEKKILERIVEPERQVIFKVAWINDKGKIEVNRGFRIQFNSAIGPYKGGLRFHPSVNLSIMKFLAFEQTFKNSLTGLAMGGAKGGSDFDPKGKSDNEVMSFCQELMTELYRHIGEQTDVPAGDIGVGGREIGYLFGQYRKIQNKFVGVLTGKGVDWGGSFIRPEATGYGATYFLNEMLKTRGTSLKGKEVTISGSGNVAQYAVQKINQLGGKVITLSDSNGSIHDPEGITGEKFEFFLDLKQVKRGRIKEYAEKFNVEYMKNKRPWEIPCDIAFPCATQNEIEKVDAQRLIENGVIAVVEGANMPTTIESTELFLENGVSFGPGKAANAGGVACSGLEMTQNSMRLTWTSEEVDARLKEIMQNIHTQAKDTALMFGATVGDKIPNYVVGANISGFMKVANAMIAQGLF